MSDLRLYIPTALTFQRLAKSAIAAANQIDQGTEMNDAHAFALLEFFEFLGPEHLTPVMGPGLASELSAIIGSEFSWASLGERTPLHTILCTHASMFAGVYCCDGDEPPRCYRTWLQFEERNANGRPFDREAYLLSNFELAMGLGRGSKTANSKLQILKYRIARRTAELLLAVGFQPEATVRHIRQEDVPNTAEILAMHAFVLLKKNPNDLARVCAWSDRSTEDTFLHWASRDSFVHYTLLAWRWLKPMAYDQFPEAKSVPLGDRRGLLHAAWREGKAAPAILAMREPPWSEVDTEPKFPRLLPRDVKPRFSRVPLMLIGGPAVGKTTFLCALAHHLDRARAQLREGMYLESTDLLEPWNLTREKCVPGENTATSETAGYNLHVRDEGDPEVARWRRLQLIDYSGEEITQRTLSPEILRNLRAARGLLFFVDNRSFPDLLPNRGVSSLAGDDHMEAAELAARYTRILQLYFDVNKNALHLPVGLVVNKADLLLGPANLLALNPPFLIPEQTKMELVHAGLGVEADAAEPIERLRSCIRYNLPISRIIQNQRLVFELIERFKGFISAVMCHTYRFQIFLTSSVVPENENRESFPYGVWDVAKWLDNQLEPAYRAQASESVQLAQMELEEMRKNLVTAVLNDQKAHAAFQKAIEHRENFAAKVRMKIFDHLLEKQAEHASERMRNALRDAFTLAGLQVVSDAEDPAPFTLRRRLAKEALERLEEQIAYMNEWHERLSGVYLSAAAHPKAPNNAMIRLSNRLASERPTT
jgi:Double-GTPase 1